MREAAALAEGTHDFAGFAARRMESDSVRTVRAIRATRRGALITLHFEGDGFLYKMVRLLTGSLVRCGLRRAEPEWIRALIEGAGKLKTHFAAPAEGLYLEKVLY